MDKRNPNNVRVTGDCMVTGLIDHKQEVFDAAMEAYKIGALAYIIDTLKDLYRPKAAAVLQPILDACRKAEEVERA